LPNDGFVRQTGLMSPLCNLRLRRS